MREIPHLTGCSPLLPLFSPRESSGQAAWGRGRAASWEAADLSGGGGLLTGCDLRARSPSSGKLSSICKIRKKPPSFSMSRGCREIQLLPHLREKSGAISTQI